MKHVINHMSFGNPEDLQTLRSRYGVTMNAELDGQTVARDSHRAGNLYVEYVIDITEAEYENLDETLQGRESKVSGYEYRSMKTVLTTYGMGAVWFKYEISPIKVHYGLYKQPFSDFLTHLCAIVGGFFAVAGIVESILRNGFCYAVAPEDLTK